MWAMSITGHSISHWLPCPVPSWVPNIIVTYGGNSVKFHAEYVAALTSLYNNRTRLGQMLCDLVKLDCK